MENLEVRGEAAVREMELGKNDAPKVENKNLELDLNLELNNQI